MKNNEGRKVEGTLVQGPDGLWREVKQPKPRQRRVKSEQEKEVDRLFEQIHGRIFGK